MCGCGAIRAHARTRIVRVPTWRFSPGGSISAVKLNGRQYLDVTFADPGGSGLDPGLDHEPGRRVHAERVGGGGRGGRRGVWLSGSTYCYAFSGSFAEGPVTGSWQDTAQNVNLAESESFTVSGPGCAVMADLADPSPGQFDLGRAQRPPGPWT